MLALTALAYLATSRNGVDLAGRPIGTDFASFWTASRLALAGNPPWPGIQPRTDAQIEAFGPGAPYAAFFYPPPYLLACLPLAQLPYGPSLAAWLVATGLACAAMTRAWLDAPRDWLLILTFPAVLLNAGHGQNGFLTAELLGAGALLGASRPRLSGVLIGALVIKPHLAVLTPLFFVLTGNWRAFIAAAVTALGLCLLSALVLGAPAWASFLETSALARQTLEDDLVGYAKMQSAFAAVRLWGAGLSLAWGVQILSATIGIIGLWRVRKVSDGLAFGTALVCATLLTTPFLLDYDFTVLSAPLAWLFSRAGREGFLPWEKVALLAGFALPLFSRPLATLLHLPPAPFVLIGLLACTHQRARRRSRRRAALIARCPSGGRMTPLLSLVVCVLDEAEAIGPVLQELDAQLVGTAAEIIVVDDSADEATASVVRAFTPQATSVRLLRRSGARGLASAAAEGWSVARVRCSGSWTATASMIRRLSRGFSPSFRTTVPTSPWPAGTRAAPIRA